MQTKTCTLCGLTKDRDEFGFVKSIGRYNARCKRCQADLAAQWRRDNPEKAKAAKVRYRQRHGRGGAHRRTRYGITPDAMEQMISAQGGGCAICGDEVSAHNGCATHVDHDHETGAVRGVLCRLCNPALGAFRDDPALLRRAAAYLEAHRETAA